MKQYQEALQEYERFIAYLSSEEGVISSEGDTGPLSFAWRSKGDMLKQLGRTNAAKEAFEKADKLKPPEDDIPF